MTSPQAHTNAARLISLAVLIFVIVFACLVLPGCGGVGSSSTTPLPSSNPVPSISTLLPPSATSGAAVQTLTINGTNFLSTSTVTYNGVPHAATFVSTTQLTISLSANDQATVGTYPVMVTNPTPGGGPSNAVNFSVDKPISATCYGSLLSGSPPTLSASVQSINSNGTVVVNGADSAQPTMPFQFTWSDGTSTSGFFPQQHVFANPLQNYVITVTATENRGTTQQFLLPVFFTAPSITQRTILGVSFQIPTQQPVLQTHWAANAPPTTSETVFSDSSFPVYSRSDVAYILAAISSIDYDFAKSNSFLLNGEFQIDMLENTTFGGGYSLWYTTPMSVGYGAPVVGPPIQWNILFNEIGKDATLNTPLSLTYGGNTDGSASEIYSETMGDVFSYASGCELISNAASYGIGPDAALDIKNSLLSGAAALQGAFKAYVAAGAPFSSWNPNNGGTDPTLGTLSTLSWKFIEHAESQGKGYQIPAKRLMTVLQLFDPSMLGSYAPTSNTQVAATFRSTLMVTALSYAFSEDLRTEFRSLNFPIDDRTFEQLYEMVTGGASVSPSMAAFAAPLGSTSAGQTFTLTNYLLTPISISGSFSGTNPNDFPVQASSTCPYPAGTLVANSSCTYVIAFAPSTNGPESATFSLTDSAQDVTQVLANSPQIIKLRGTGTTTP
jgi:hypothetical protein